MPTLHGTVVGSGAGSGLEHPDLGISKFPPTFCFLFFLVLFSFILSYFILISIIFLFSFSRIFS